MAVERGQNTAQKRLNAALQPQEGPLSTRWLLLEEEERWKDYKRRSYEVKSSGDGVYLRMLRPLSDSANLPSTLLLAASEPGHRAGPLLERAVS